jgi:hypothetical protein
MLAKILAGFRKETKQPERRMRVLVVAASGRRYLLQPELFHSRTGRDHSLFALHERNPAKVAKRLLEKLCPEVDMRHCEHIDFSNLGSRRTWHVAWFPTKKEFNEDIIAHDHHYVPLFLDPANQFLKERELDYYNRLCDKAIAQRQQRYPALATTMVA